MMFLNMGWCIINFLPYVPGACRFLSNGRFVERDGGGFVWSGSTSWLRCDPFGNNLDKILTSYREQGYFLTPWKNQPYLRLHPYKDIIFSDPSYERAKTERIKNEKISLFPLEGEGVITGKK